MSKLKPLNLYIHIPYCKARCRYCNFYVIAGRTPHLPLYFRALKNELTSFGNLKDFEFKTIYFGGGTPSLVDAKSIIEIIDFVKSNYQVADDLDISIEVNPENITSEKLQTYYDAGIQRMSIGLQAWQDSTLKYMGRLYTIEEFLKLYSIAQNSPIININLDLIFGIPNQTLENWIESISNVVKLNPNHISCYSLEIDDRSIYGMMESKGLFKRADEGLDREMYKFARHALKEAGYNHYEISNFSKPGFESKHNLAIWNGGEYIGLGASAHSYFQNKRFNNIYDIDQYVLKNLKGEIAHEEITDIDIKQQKLEFITLQLRLIKGLSLLKFRDKFSKDFDLEYSNIVRELVNEKLGLLDKKYFVLTARGLDLESYVISKFIV